MLKVHSRTILGSIVSIIRERGGGDLNDHPMSIIMITLITDKAFIEAPSIMMKAAIASMIRIDSISHYGPVNTGPKSHSH